jgi:hypothetical protein
MDLGTYLPSPRLSIIPEEPQELEEEEDVHGMQLELEESLVEPVGDRVAVEEVTAEIDVNGD